MIAAIMQPYFFPYIGYFQLMNAVDTFVIYDDAQYMKGGWINRNRILTNGKATWLTLPVSRASLTLSINQRHYLCDGDGVDAIKRRLRRSYEQVRGFEMSYPIVCQLLDFPKSNVALFNANLLNGLAAILGIQCRFIMSSDVAKPSELRGESRIIDLCLRIGADHYINPIGGLALYTSENFKAADVRLSFLRTAVTPFDTEMGYLSIIDDLMRYGISGCASQLSSYKILEAGCERAQS
jgi:hypothetical protein